MQRPLPLMFIVSMLAASVAFAEPPAHASRYQPDMGARYGHASGTYSQRPEAAAETARKGARARARQAGTRRGAMLQSAPEAVERCVRPG